MRRSRTLSLVTLGVVVAGSLLTVAIFRLKTSQLSPDLAAASPNREAYVLAGTKATIAEDARLIGQRTAEVAQHRLQQLGLTARDSQEIGRVVTEAISLYWGGELEDFLRSQERQGLSVPRGLKGTGGAALWRTWNQSVLSAPMDPGGIALELRMKNGERLPEPVPASGVTNAGVLRTADGPGEVDPVASRCDVIEVMVPAVMRTRDGKPFAGRFGLKLTRRPTDRAWIVIGTTIRDHPQGSAVVVPVP